MRRRGGPNTATAPPSGPALVQFKSANNRMLTLDATPASGNKLWIAFSRNGSGHGSVCATPTGFTRLNQLLTTTTSERGTAQFVKECGGSESATITVDDPGGNEYELHVFEFSGLIDTDGVDQTTSSASGGSLVNTQATGTTGTTTQANEVIVASLAVAGAPMGRNPTVSNSFTRQSDIANADRSAVAYRIVTATGTYSTTFDWSGAGSNNCYATALICTVKAAS